MAGPTPRASARERILDTAYALFAQRGVRAVGVDELIRRSGVAKATFYRHFRTKDALVVAYLDRWYAIRSATLTDLATGLTETPGPDDERAERVFTTIIDAWFRHDVADVSAFVHVLVEMGSDHPLGRTALDHLAALREQIAALARRLGLARPDDFAWSFHLLTKGAIISALEGDERAPVRSATLARWLVDSHRTRPSDPPPSR